METSAFLKVRPAGSYFAGVVSWVMRDRARLTIAVLCAMLIAGAFLAPPTPFIVDGSVYHAMAKAMAERGDLHIADNGGVEGAPPLTKWLTRVHDGKVYAQYPAGYAFIAAPFYKIWGVHGLMLMNALSAAAAIIMTFRLSRRLEFDRNTSFIAVLLLACASYFSTYFFGIWPHALSVALYLGAILAAVEGTRQKSRRKALALFLSSGLLVGVGVNIRVDAILALPVIFIWLRLFAVPKDRTAALAFVAGVVPGLVLSAFLNWLKFGQPAPFSYGAEAGVISASAYQPLAAAGALLLVLLAFFNVRKTAESLWRSHRQFVLLGILVALCGLFLATWPATRSVLRGAWVLVFDLQALRPEKFQTGVGYNEYGHLLFWDFPKRALTQSAPFLALAVIPLVHFFRGRFVEAYSLFFLAAGAPVFFYAINEWHGGGCYNLRYFLPILPFACILCAKAVTELAAGVDLSCQRVRIRTLFAGVGGFMAFMFAHEISVSHPAYRAPFDLYPQTVLFFALALLAALVALAPRLDRRLPMAAFFVGSFVIGYSASVSFIDEVTHEKTRIVQFRMAERLAEAIPQGALILGEYQAIANQAEDKGAILMEVYDNETASTVAPAAQAARAFSAAGRCVYFQGAAVRRLMAAALPVGAIAEEPVVIAPPGFSEQGYLAFYALQNQGEDCALSK